jgi:hypothetical protein
MCKTTAINLAAFGSRLSPPAHAVFRSLYENARDMIVEEGPRESYEKPLAELMEECGLAETEAVADAIKEIIQRRIDYKKDEFQYFFGFFASIIIEDGIIKYGLPREIEDAIPQSGIQDIG